MNCARHALTRSRRAMPARVYLIIALVLSLLFTPQMPTAMAQPVESKMPGCAMTTCVTGCCAQMACCVRSARDKPQPEQAPAPRRVNLELAALGLRTFTILYVLPAVERRLAPREDAQAAHTLPRLAATCIQLI